MSKVSVISSEVKAHMRDGKLPFTRQMGGANEIGNVKLGPAMFENLLGAINSLYGWTAEKPNTLHITFDGSKLPTKEFMEAQGWTEGGFLTSKGKYHLAKDHLGLEFATHLYGSPAKVMDSEYLEHTVVYTSLYVDGASVESTNLPEGEQWLARVSRYSRLTEKGMVEAREVPPLVFINPLIEEADAEILQRSLVDPLTITVQDAEPV